VKVHFAGMQLRQWAAPLCEVAGVKYALWTVFPYIAAKHGVKASRGKTGDGVPAYLESKCRHVIMDSGLFTLMFGAHAGKRDAKFMEAWQESMVEHVTSIGYKGAVVEVDCQKVLGVREAWRLRKMLKDSLPDHELINVFHHEDGRDGLDEMIEFSEYISVSVPELRGMHIPNLADYVTRQAAYIKNKKPSVKIHLLGCTAAQIMERCRFCDSSDSTSWQEVMRYRFGKVNVGGRMRPFRRADFAELIKGIEPRVDDVLKAHRIKKGKNGNHYHANVTAASIELLRWYDLKAGSQE